MFKNRSMTSLFAGWLLLIPLVMSSRAQANDNVLKNNSLQAQSITSETAIERAGVWFHVSDEKHILEGAAFERNGDLLFCDFSGYTVYRLTKEKRLTRLVTLRDLQPGGVAVHKDGHIFIAANNMTDQQGGIFVVNPDGSGLRPVVPLEKGFLPNDLVFDADGSFYFTDFKGTSNDTLGGVYHVSSDFKKITPVKTNLSRANGLALDPSGRILWVSEYGRSKLHRITLDKNTFEASQSTEICHFDEPAPDSMRTDSRGNLYIAMNGQGKVLVLAPDGKQIDEIILPNSEQGQNLYTTSLAISAQSQDLFIVSMDDEGQNGANIFHAKAKAKSDHLYSHQ